jgi:choice-of-anchor A domain-containing protein
VAGDFNVFVFGGLTQSYTDAQGRVAAGGDVSLTGYGVGDALTNSAGTRDDLVVGGSLTYNQGQVFNGNIVYGGTALLTNVGLPNGTARQGTVLDFQAAQAQLTSLSAGWAALAPNGTTVNCYGTLSMTGRDPAFNVFSVPGSQLASAYGLNVSAPAGSTVLINVSGTAGQMQYFGMTVSGTDRQHVLLNFSTAATLTLAGISVQGSILAPSADVAFNNGNLEGTLIAHSMTGSGEFHNYRTQFQAPASKTTPTVSVTDAGGIYNGQPFPTTATVTGTGGGSGSSLEGVSPTLNYYSGSSTTGTPLAGAPRTVGTYTVVAAFPGSADYTAASAHATFTISPAPLTVMANSATRVYGQANPAFPAGYTGFVGGDSPASLRGTLSVSTPATAASPVGTYAVTPSGLTSSNYAIRFVNGALTVTPAPLTVTANSASRAYGVANPTLTGTIAGLQNGDAITATYTTSATTASPVGTYPIAPAVRDSIPGKLCNYTVRLINGTLTVLPAALTATGQTVSATAGAPFSDVVASLTDHDLLGTAGSYTAVISWGDGSSSAGTVAATGPGAFTVSGTHVYGAAGSYPVSVRITDVDGGTASVAGSAHVTTLGTSVQKGLTGTIGFWHNPNGQALIDSFNGGPSSTALANWLAVTFPDLYGVRAGAGNLTGKTNAQVAAFYLTLFNASGMKLAAQVLDTALDLYATTASLGGPAATGYGFTVSAVGLGASSYNVGPSGAAFGVANNTSLDVYQILVAADRQAVNGVLYNGSSTLQNQANTVFDGINQTGDIG